MAKLPLLKSHLFWKTYVLTLGLICLILASVFFIFIQYLPITSEKSSLISVTPVRWVVVAQAPASSVREPMNSLEHLIILLCATLPLLILVGLFTRTVLKPIRSLYIAVNQGIPGNYPNRIESTTDQSEIGKLTQRFNELLTSLHESKQRITNQEQLMQKQKEFLMKVINTSPNYIFTRDRSGSYTMVNQAFADLYGLKEEDLIGKSPWELNEREVAKRHLEEDREILDGRMENLILEDSFTDHQGAVHWVQAVKIPLLSNEGSREHILFIATDITERKKKEEEIIHLAYHDSLTGLPNRLLFLKRLSEALEQSGRTAIMFLDLDDFKIVNDNLGHDIGDMLLQQVGERLEECLQPGDTVARMGGDEFTILLSAIRNEHHVVEIAERLIDTLTAPFSIRGHELQVTTSIGIAISPEHGAEMKPLLKHGDMAMYVAKDKGKNNYQFYRPHMSESLFARMNMESQLRKALDRNEFEVQYQLKVDGRTGKRSGLEALLRWHNKEIGQVPPSQFIKIAEVSGLIVPIGEWVLRTACSQAKAWQLAGYTPLRVAINISPRQIGAPLFLQTVQQILKDTELDPQWLELEITESMILDDSDSVISTLTALQNEGVVISIDDFGTGHSSLSYLKKLPVNTLKIDRSFVSEITTDDDNRAIVRAIIAMAHRLKLSVVAEGVETGEQFEILKKEGCDEMQGYYIGYPVPALALTSLFKEV